MMNRMMNDYMPSHCWYLTIGLDTALASALLPLSLTVLICQASLPRYLSIYFQRYFRNSYSLTLLNKEIISSYSCKQLMNGL
jgi:hypothetical protein